MIDNGNCLEVVNQLKKRVLTVSISANKYFQFYKEGIYTLWEPENKLNAIKSSGTLNLALTLYGYNPSSQFYVKNSWGREWGA